MTEKKFATEDELGSAIRLASSINFGGFDNSILCKSVGMLNPHTPICVAETEQLGTVLELFAKRNISSVLVVDSEVRLVGIVTERDCIRKGIVGSSVDRTRPIAELMTPNPQSQSPDITIAFALNLMAHGGYRHIPLVDEDGHPIGMVSIRDVMNYMVEEFMDDLLAFETVDEGRD